MQTTLETSEMTPSRRTTTDHERYARTVAASKRVRWDIDADVIRGREFDMKQKFLPDTLARMEHFDFLSPSERRYVGQIQGRTYANVFGLVERFINAKVLEISREHWMGDQVALEALVRFSDEELKHQELFRRIEKLAGRGMPSGYEFAPKPDEVAGAVLGKSTWAVLGLTLDIELFTQLHYRSSIAPDEELSPLFKDVFLYHWREESQHANLDELEWVRCDRALTLEERDRAVDELIELVGAVDSIVGTQAVADAQFFAETCGRALSTSERAAVEAGMTAAYRWQYVLSGAAHPHFVKVLTSLITPEQSRRVQAAIGSLS